MSTYPGPIRFFDIASAPPRRTYAPNPWKTRYVASPHYHTLRCQAFYYINNPSYAINAKAVPYTTEWVELPDIKCTRLKYGVAPVRKLPRR
jgi:hypothetical protein